MIDLIAIVFWLACFKFSGKFLILQLNRLYNFQCGDWMLSGNADIWCCGKEYWSSKEYVTSGENWRPVKNNERNVKRDEKGLSTNVTLTELVAYESKITYFFEHYEVQKQALCKILMCLPNVKSWCFGTSSLVYLCVVKQAHIFCIYL